MLLLQPEGAVLGAAGRWRPVLRAVLAAMRKQAAGGDDERARADQLECRLQAMQDKVGRDRPFWPTPARLPHLWRTLVSGCAKLSDGESPPLILT